jgi:hypothetical protein
MRDSVFVHCQLRKWAWPDGSAYASSRSPRRDKRTPERGAPTRLSQRASESLRCSQIQMAIIRLSGFPARPNRTCSRRRPPLTSALPTARTSLPRRDPSRRKSISAIRGVSLQKIQEMASVLSQYERPRTPYARILVIHLGQPGALHIHRDSRIDSPPQPVAAGSPARCTPVVEQQVARRPRDSC